MLITNHRLKDLSRPTLTEIENLIDQSSAYDDLDLQSAYESNANVIILRDDNDNANANTNLVGIIIYRNGLLKDFCREPLEGLSATTTVVYLELLQIDQDYHFKGYASTLLGYFQGIIDYKTTILTSTPNSRHFWLRRAQPLKDQWFLL